ncbi:helix-turn-helix transcriptional regulator [Halobium salinum]|uniref:Helix-turn-helix transcriptional regulator n=1 Tax=Halobium salinum TaxID=1364940 RepID=A0ABD5PDM5_9EURY|nr:MarR family transcriptional regulator [Halobium salinum]
MTDSDPDEIMAAVARRGDVLEVVGGDGTRKRDLVASLDISRSTVDRAVRELEGTGLVERTTDGYRRTLAGELALREYRRFADHVAGVLECRPLLAELPPDTPFDGALVDGCEVVRPTRHSPNRPVTRLTDLVRRARDVRAFGPAVFPQQVDAYHESIVDRGMEAEILLAEAVVERLVSSYSRALSEALDTGKLAVRVADGPLPYSLTVAETADGPAVGLLVYADGGSVSGYLGNDGPEAVRWAEREFERRWDRGRPLSGIGES